jgi:hypothetical protein
MSLERFRLCSMTRLLGWGLVKVVGVEVQLPELTNLGDVMCFVHSFGPTTPS